VCFLLQGLETYWGENMNPKTCNIGFNRKHNYFSQSSTKSCKDLDNSTPLAMISSESSDCVHVSATSSYIQTELT